MRERKRQVTVEITVDWELKSVYLTEPGERPVEIEFSTPAELANIVTMWLAS